MAHDRSGLSRHPDLGSWAAIVWSLSLLSGMVCPQVSAATPRDAGGMSVAVCAGLIERTTPHGSAIGDRLTQLLPDSRHPSNPSLVMVAFPDCDDRLQDMVVQVFRGLPGADEKTLNPDGTVRSRLGDDLYHSADGLMNLLYHEVDYLGNQVQVRRQQRAYEAGLGGDLTFLREMTVEPLRVIAVLPAAEAYLPRSLRGRVDSIVVDAKLSFGKWDSRISFVTPDGETAEAVAFVVSAWREMAVHMAETFAAYRTGQDLRAALRGSTVQVVANRVVSTGSIPAQTAVRVTHELAGYGPPDRVTICHNGHTLSVSQAAVPAHLAHGDTLGPCPGDDPGGDKGNNGLGNGEDPPPPGNPPVNDGPGTTPGGRGKIK